jgi:hypothetical protein
MVLRAYVCVFVCTFVYIRACVHVFDIEAAIGLSPSVSMCFYTCVEVLRTRLYWT